MLFIENQTREHIVKYFSDLCMKIHFLYSIGGVSVWPHMQEIWHMGTQSTQCTCVFFNSCECMTLHEQVHHMIVVHTVV
jgi:hypothetical protein